MKLENILIILYAIIFIACLMWIYNHEVHAAEWKCDYYKTFHFKNETFHTTCEQKYEYGIRFINCYDYEKNYSIGTGFNPNGIVATSDSAGNFWRGKNLTKQTKNDKCVGDGNNN